MSRILVVSKNLGLRTFLRITFGLTVGIDVTPATSQVLPRAMDTRPELVILDALAADCDLPSLLHLLRARLPRCRAVVLAQDMGEHAIAYLAVPVTVALLYHPIDLRQLVRRMEGLLDGQQQGDTWPALNRTVERLVAYMSEHYHEHLRLHDLAAVVNMSPDHLEHIFQAAVGTSVMRFLTMIRVEAARDLLADSDGKLESVAESVGFCDAPHFSRVFYRLTGFRPGRYRRQVMDALPASQPPDRRLPGRKNLAIFLGFFDQSVALWALDALI